MATITTRAGKGSPLTNTEVDNNFTNLNTDKAEVGANSDITSLSGITGGVSTVDYVDFDTAASIARATGRIKWNDTDGTLEVGLKGSEVTLQVGQETVLRVYNNDTTTISNGQTVYIQSSSNGNVAVKKAIADGSIDYEKTVGVATESIAAGSYGYVCFGGLVRGVNTSSYAVGDSLYVSETTAGSVRVGHPASPNVPMHIGMVVDVNVTQGVLFIDTWTHTPADESVYDNSDSTLVATNVKGAIDELDFKKADTSILSANVNTYPTTASHSSITGYKQIVTNILDPDFDDVAVDVSTGELTTTTDVLIASLASEANIFTGDVGGTNVTVIGNIRRSSGNGEGRFHFKVYHRTAGGTETLIGTSGFTDEVASSTYVQFSSSTFLATQTFTSTDLLVLKFYGKLVASGSAFFDFQFGGTEPVRGLFPVGVNVIPVTATAAEIIASTTNFSEVLSGSDTTIQAALDTIDDHGHAISKITGLQDALDSKANTSSLGALATADSVGSSTIDDNSVGAAELNVSGDGLTTQFLRSDGDGSFSWAVPTDTNTTYTAGSGLSLTGTEFAHADTSTQASSDNANGVVIQDITLDGFGHITGLGTVNLDSRYFTETEADNRFLKRSGGTMTGPIVVDRNSITASSTSTAIDFSAAQEFVITMTANTSFLFNNVTAGQTGVLYIKQDATGGRVFTLPAIAKTPRGGATIVQETGANSISVLSYAVLDTSNVLINYIGDFA